MEQVVIMQDKDFRIPAGAGHAGRARCSSGSMDLKVDKIKEHRPFKLDNPKGWKRWSTGSRR